MTLDPLAQLLKEHLRVRVDAEVNEKGERTESIVCWCDETFASGEAHRAHQAEKIRELLEAERLAHEPLLAAAVARARANRAERDKWYAERYWLLVNDLDLARLLRDAADGQPVETIAGKARGQCSMWSPKLGWTGRQIGSDGLPEPPSPPSGR